MKAFFRKVNAEEASVFKISKGLLTISVGQETHEGEFLKQTVDLINQSFNSCVILVDDTLQRHTMALYENKSPEYCYEKSLKLGDLWLERNKKYYNSFTIPYKIIRWNMWLEHRNFLLQKNIIKDLINKNKDYNDAFQYSIDSFFKKYIIRVPIHNLIDKYKAKLYIYEYLLEECTALSLWPELNCQYKIYTSVSNLAMHKTHEMLVLPKYPSLLYEATIGFRNAGQIHPQEFGEKYF